MKRLILSIALILMLPAVIRAQTLPCPTGKVCSGSVPFTVTFPTPSTPGAVAPASAVQGSAALPITLTAASGATFNNQMIVEICQATPTVCTAATDLATTFVSTTSLSATIPVTVLANSGTISIYLSQPSGAHAILLQWQDTTPTVVSYNIYRSTVSGGPTQASVQHPA